MGGLVNDRDPYRRSEYYQDGIDHVYDRSLHRDGNGRDREREHDDRRRSIDDARSYTSSRHSKRSHRHRSSSQNRPPLTETNLRTLSEVSSAAPSGVPKGYRSPYAETASRALTLSRPTLAARTMTVPASPSALMQARAAPPPPSTATPVSTPRQSMLVHRPRSDSSLRKKPKEIDMNLAYGSIPPDLESRVDLDPNYKNSPELQEEHARTLMGRVEGLLVEAQCVHHTATAIISHLQANPEAAAAVALTLAELSALLGKMSPAFLGVVKGGSPAVFALLASPQFLIAAGVAVGVTIVMFGGWKIVKRIKEANKEKQQQAFEAEQPTGGPEPVPNGGQAPPPMQPGGYGFAQGMAYGGGPGTFDEALVLEEELSTIETWRRGIAPFGDSETADIELMSPEAERTILERHRDRENDEIDPSDSVSRSGRTSRTHRTSKSHRTSKGRRGSDHGRGESEMVPERKSSKAFTKDRERDRDDRGSRSGRSEGSHKSSRHGSISDSKRPERISHKAIEDGSRKADNTLEAVLRPKEKKNNSMLRTLFKKKKNKEDHETERPERGEISVLV